MLAVSPGQVPTSLHKVVAETRITRDRDVGNADISCHLCAVYVVNGDENASENILHRNNHMTIITET